MSGSVWSKFLLWINPGCPGKWPSGCCAIRQSTGIWPYEWINL